MTNLDSLMIIGHRGAAGLAPENTLPSFQKAIDLGVDAIELDIHFRDGRLWVIHDGKLDRTTNGTGRLDAYSATQLRDLNAGNGARIPFLEEVIAMMPPDMLLNIELKGRATAAPLARLLDQYDHPKLLVSSFNHQELREFAELRPEVPVAPLFDRWRDDPIATGRAFGSGFINLSARIASKQRCQQIIAAGMRMLVYTVNDVALAQTLAARGVSGIFTDYPNLFRTGARAH